jgi:fibro-slime domain-containing protein
LAAEFYIMKQTWLITSLLLGLGCSAGGSADGNTVTTSPVEPGTLAPASASNPSSSGAVPAQSTGQLFDPEQLEPGEDTCDGNIPVVFRDFSDTHPDFEMDFSGDVVRRTLISPTLGTGDKPTFASSVGCPAKMSSPTACDTWSVDKPVITSATTFDQWYRTVNGVNIAFDRELALVETPAGSGIYKYSSTSFFPLGPTEGLGITPPNQDKNFLFTTEIHLNFEYVSGQRFTFQGDDDLWIFINKRLALDLGSMHSSQAGTIDFDAQAADLGITPGRAYAMDIFHAERHTSASNFSIETNIACFTPATVY